MIEQAYESLFAVPKVGFAGDWHGSTGWVRVALMSLANKGVRVVYQVGDFGLWGGMDGATYLRKVQQYLDELDMLLIVVPGNHENYDMLEKMPVLDDGWICRPSEPRIVYAPRGHVWTHQHVRFAALGGTVSIDKRMRTVGKSWWSQEEITQSDVDTLIRNVEASGWEMVDVLLTHDSPAGVRINTGPTPSWTTPEIVHHCWQQRVLLRDAVDFVTPAWLIHGHWHRVIRENLEGVSLRDDREFSSRVIGLSMEGGGNTATATLTPLVGLTEFSVHF